jgi:hypothetical protein
MSEVILTVGLVLLFFLVLQTLLGLSFPQGMSLKDLVTSRGTGEMFRPGDRTERSFVAGAGIGADIAVLAHVDKKVKHKPFNALTWGETESGMPLARQHAVQTFEKAAATISFDEGSELEMGEKSLIVLKDVESGREGSRRRASLVVLDGELRGRIKGKGRETLAIEVETGSGSTRMAADATAATPTSFSVSLNDDGSSIFSVYEGSAEVTSEGKTVVVESNEVVKVEKAQQPEAPRPLPTPPQLTDPPDDAVFYYRSQPPHIHFKWSEQADSDSYYYTLARDPEFKETVFKGRLTESHLMHGNLEEGTYYWRASGVRADLLGSPSRARRLRVLRDAEAPLLRIDAPEPITSEDTVLITGAVDPGTRVFVSHEEVTVRGTGEFEYTLHLQRGLNLVVIEAIDKVGNTAYQSHLVRARY